jgi:diguanylate cyclase
MERDEALTRLVMRLSHVAEGVDREADAVLEDIREQLRADASGEQLEALSGKLARVLMSKVGIDPDARRTENGGYDLSGLSKLIKSMPVRGEEQQRMGKLVQRIASGTTSAERQKALVDLLSVSMEALREAASRDKSDRGVLGWLGKKGDDKGGDRYVALFVALLQRLIEHLDILNGSEMRSQSIRDSLQNITGPEQAHQLLEEVTAEIESIDARIRAERGQTTDFLGDLRERLDGFEGVLQLLADGGDESLQRSETLKEEVESDTREIGAATRVDDVQEMRARIGDGLGKIAARLAEHVVAERKQNEQSRAKVQELTDRLTLLEGEAEVLRSEIRSKSDLALKDSLTGIYNRAGYEERVVELFARWQRSGSPLSLVFVDCNRFKEINDTYGHAAGDLVLVKVADVLQQRARASDIVCRYGGDEFVILLPDTDAKGADVFARSAFEEVRNAGFNDNGRPLDVSISCGVTQLVSGDDMEVAMARADEAMYQAKKMDGVRVASVLV